MRPKTAGASLPPPGASLPNDPLVEPGPWACGSQAAGPLGEAAVWALGRSGWRHLTLTWKVKNFILLSERE